MAGGPVDMRMYFLHYIHHPEKLPEAMKEMEETYREARKSGSKPRPPKVDWSQP
jgi:hypothetical protein